MTLAPLHELQASEIELAMAQAGAIPAVQASAPPLVGLGVNHAFASPTGRLRLLDSVGPDGQEGSELPLESRPAEERLTYASGGRAYEWFSLAGLPCDMRVDGLDLTTQRREGAAFVAGERNLAELRRRC